MKRCTILSTKRDLVFAVRQNGNTIQREVRKENNFSAVTDDTAFYVNGDQKLVIVFNEGDVAPMYMGAVEFVIPPEVTEPLAREGFFAA